MPIVIQANQQSTHINSAAYCFLPPGHYLCLALKNVVAILLVMVVLSQTWVKVGVVVYYNINKAYISQQLCENRNKPTLQCNGHCYLAKQLKKTEEGAQPQMADIFKAKEEYISKTAKVVLKSYTPVYAVTRLFTTPFFFRPLNSATFLLRPPIA